MVSLQEVCRHNLPFIAGYGSQWQATTGGGISRPIHTWNRHTLQEFVDAHSPLLPFDPCSIQIQVVDLRHATCRMNDHLRLKRARFPRGQGPDNYLPRTLFDPCRLCSEMNVNAKFASPLHELINQIRIKKGKRMRATV